MRHVLASTMLALSFALAACGSGDGPTALHTQVDCTASVTASTIRVMQGQNTALSITYKGVLDATLSSDNDTQYVVPKSVYRGSANDSFEVQVSPTQSTLYTLRATCANNTTTTPSAALVDVVVPGTVVPEQPTVVGVLGQKVILKFKFTNVQGCVVKVKPTTVLVPGSEAFQKGVGTVDISYVEDSYGVVTVSLPNTMTANGQIQGGYVCDDVNVANQKDSAFTAIILAVPPLVKLDSVDNLSASKMNTTGDRIRVYISTPSCTTDNTVGYGGTRMGFDPQHLGQLTCVSPYILQGYVKTVGAPMAAQDVTFYVQQPGGGLLLSITIHVVQ